MLRQIAKGVEYLHDNNIIHRDLKPKNILYRSSPLVMKVADFGCSRSVTGDATHYTRTVESNGQFRVFGTDGWLAPEVLNELLTELKPLKSVDIYPLGLIFAFTLCGGQHPYGDENGKTINERIKNKQPMPDVIQQQLIDEQGKECYNLIDRMLNPNPNGRPTAADVLKDENLSIPRPVFVRDQKVRYDVA